MRSCLRKTFLLLAAAMAAALLGAGGAAASCPGEGSPPTALTDAALEQAILCVINEQRVGAGRVPVTPNPRLAATAARHSAEMVQEGYFAHTSPAGVGFIDRVLAGGYTEKARDWVVGENLAWGTGSIGAPSSIVDAWMASHLHRLNVVNARFRDIGVAVVRGTPFDRTAPNGVTVSTEYGFRSGKSKRKAKAKAKARSGRSRKR